MLDLQNPSFSVSIMIPISISAFSIHALVMRTVSTIRMSVHTPFFLLHSSRNTRMVIDGIHDSLHQPLLRIWILFIRMPRRRSMMRPAAIFCLAHGPARRVFRRGEFHWTCRGWGILRNARCRFAAVMVSVRGIIRTRGALGRRPWSWGWTLGR